MGESRVLSTGKVLRVITAYAERPKEPIREEYKDLTDEEFREWHDMWKEECREFDKNNHEPDPNKE